METVVWRLPGSMMHATRRPIYRQRSNLSSDVIIAYMQKTKKPTRLASFPGRAQLSVSSTAYTLRLQYSIYTPPVEDV